MRNINKSYRMGTQSLHVLKDVSLTVKQGEYLAILGPSGSGKSTLMNILTGNLRQTAGEIRFNGAEIRSLGAAFRGRVGYMPPQQTLYPGFTAERFLLYMASLRRMPRARALERIDWNTPALTETFAAIAAPLPEAEDGARVAAVALDNASSMLNVRAEPSAEASVRGQLKNGRRVLVSGEPDGDGWGRVRTAEWSGWCKAEYLTGE